MDNSAAFAKVADHQAITDKIYRYARSVDRIDEKLGYTVWHEDGTADYGADIYQGSGRGFIDWCCESHRHKKSGASRDRLDPSYAVLKATS